MNYEILCNLRDFGLRDFVLRYYELVPNRLRHTFALYARSLISAPFIHTYANIYLYSTTKYNAQRIFNPKSRLQNKLKNKKCEVLGHG